MHKHIHPPDTHKHMAGRVWGHASQNRHLDG